MLSVNDVVALVTWACLEPVTKKFKKVVLFPNLNCPKPLTIPGPKEPNRVIYQIPTKRLEFFTPDTDKLL